MLFDIIRGNFSIANVIYLLLSLPVILIALSFHELAHGYVAYKMGDPTARNLGRLTLNPLKHLDPMGTLSMFVFGFGWAKPVPINTRYFKNGKRGMALTAVAGPIANLLLAFIGVILALITEKLFYLTNQNIYVEVLGYFFWIFYTLNTYLAIFNLLPIPPFDGSRLAFIFLPDRLYFGIMKYERIIMLVLLGLLFFGFLTKPLIYISNLIISGMFFIVGLIPGL